MFRKNQKVMMAVVTVLAMFAFVFLGSWSKMGGPSNEIQNPEVFTWKYGTVRRSDIQNQRYMRQMVRQFLLMARQATGEDPRQAQMMIAQTFPITDDKIIESLVLQKKADDLGIVISDKVVNDFLRGWTGDRNRTCSTPCVSNWPRSVCRKCFPPCSAVSGGWAQLSAAIPPPIAGIISAV
jgi:hypothetical protein